MSEELNTELGKALTYSILKLKEDFGDIVGMFRVGDGKITFLLSEDIDEETKKEIRERLVVFSSPSSDNNDSS